MKSHKRKRRAVTTVPLAALGAGLLVSTPEGAEAAAQAGPPAGAPARTVTLVTGDRVTLNAEGQVTGVVAAEGRTGMAFRVQQAAGHAYVVPRDAERLIANGTADRRLFDVRHLVSSRYDDARRSDLPLIVTYDKGTSVSASTFRSSGATVRRDLPSINGDAVRARKSEASDLWETLPSATRSVKHAQLTEVKVVVGTPAKGKITDISAAPLMPSGFYNPFSTEGRLPLTGTDYVLPNGIKWFYQASQLGAPDAEGDPTWENTQVSAPRAYAAGRDYTQRFNAAYMAQTIHRAYRTTK